MVVCYGNSLLSVVCVSNGKMNSGRVRLSGRGMVMGGVCGGAWHWFGARCFKEALKGFRPECRLAGSWC